MLELNNARLRTNEKTEQVLVAAVHYCVWDDVTNWCCAVNWQLRDTKMDSW